MTAVQLVALSAGTRSRSSSTCLADRLAEATSSAAAEIGLATVIEVIELRDHARNIIEVAVGGKPAPALAAAISSVTGADALIAVTPLFQASYSGLFKSFFDVLGRATMAGTPVLLGATGGTSRHSLALDATIRPLFTYLRAAVVPTAVFAAPHDWAATVNDTNPLTERIDQAGRELAQSLMTKICSHPTAMR